MKNHTNCTPDRVGRKTAIIIAFVVAFLFVLCAAFQFFFGSEPYDTSRHFDVGNGRYADGLVLDGGKVVDESEIAD